MLHPPSGGALSGTATADRASRSIGAVLNLLRHEFPEVTLSKIRFLESEGLVEPQRTPSGYRKFTPEDVERLSLVLRLQRDHYLPLRVIREHLEAWERGEEPALPTSAQTSGSLVESGEGDAGEGAGSVRAPAQGVQRAELLEATGITEDELASYESFGLVSAESDGTYTSDAVEIAQLVARLGRHGLEPRHLRAVKAAAEREADLVEQLVAPLRKHRNPQTRAHAGTTARELAALSVRLHAAILHTAVRDNLS